MDNDGDLDLIINNLEDPAFIYENRSDQVNENQYLKFDLSWPNSPNVKALNSKVEIYSSIGTLSREVLPTAGFQSGRSTVLHFGIPKNLRIDSSSVIWPNGAAQRIEIDSLDKTYSVIYSPSFTSVPFTDARLFEEIDPSSIGLEFIHRENVYSDFEKEILLPHKQSTLGPALEVGDVNNDGLDDVFIGGASGQKASLFIQNKKGEFTSIRLSDRREWENIDATIFDSDNDGDGDLYLVNGGNEDEENRRDMYYLNQGTSGMIEYPRGRPGMKWPNGSCVVHADFDGNGFQDLFVGGGSKPGHYPLVDSSYMLLNENGRFSSPETPWISDFSEAGFITSAVSTDFNQDGKSDLVLAGEWLPVMFYMNTGSSFKNVTSELNLEEEVGWWCSLKVADLNQDGIDDIIAGNIGENHKFRPTKENPFRIFYDDYDKNGTGDIVLANTLDDGTSIPVRGKQCMTEQMPIISEEKVSSYGEFANSELDQLLGKDPESSKVSLSATQFSSCVFYSTGNGTFKREILPPVAQISPMNGIEVVDINNDGQLDIISAGNRFNTEVETTRADAGVGCVLLSGTDPVTNSGFFTPGNVKDIQVIKTPKQTYVIVVNNNSKTQVFRVLNQ